MGDARCTLLGEAPPTAACLHAAGFHPGDDGAWHGDGLLVRLTPAAPAEAQATAEGLASFLHSRGAAPAVVAAVGAARVVVGLVAAPGPAPALEALLPALAAEMRGHVLVGEALFDGAGLRVFPAPDVQVHPARLAAQLGFLRVATPPPHLALRPPDALRAAARAQAAIAWRLQHPGPVDFAPVAAAAGAPGLCGPDGDLPLQGAPAAAAAPALFATCRSVAAERHHAFAWLIGARALYRD